MFLEQWAAFGSLEEDDLSVPVFCLLILPVIMALSLFKDKVLSYFLNQRFNLILMQVLMKMITDSLPSKDQKNDDAMKRNDETMIRLEKAIQHFEGLQEIKQ